MVSSAQTPGTAAPESRRERAFDLHERGELEAAARDYREVLELAPDDLEVMHALGLLELQRARYDAAAVWLGKALQGRQTAAPAARAQLHAQLGSALFGAGRATAALEALDRAIALDPSGKSVHLQRAAVLESLGRYPEALASYEAVTALAPADPLAYLKRAGLLLIRGLPVEALSAVNRAIELGAVTAESYTVRGLAERALGSTVQAQASYRQALRIEPRFVPALVNQGILARAAGRSAEALDLYDRALEIQPDSLEALLNRAAVLLDLERPEQALESAERAARRYPDRADVGLHRAEALARLARLDEALAVYDAMLATNAAQPMALAGRAFVLQHLGRHAEALESSARAMELAPGLAAAHFNHGAALRDLGRIEEAVTRMEVACALEPHNPTHQCNLGGLLLLQGHFERGLELYEWRSELPETPKVHRYPTPRWQGREDLRGRTLFTYLDQGLGDTIQFARYARLAEQGGARVIVSAQSSLLRLLRSMSPTLELLAEAEAPERYDLHCPLASLPRAFGTTLASIPASVPYLFAEPERIATWRQRLGVHGLKVGVCWQGAIANKAGIGRSFPLAALSPVAALAGVRLISLQCGPGVEQLEGLPEGMFVETLGEDFDTGPDAFIDAAAVMQSLDLVITCDTSIAHLAGALGCATWVLLKHVPDWRWLMARHDSPWYPTMRLYRQQRAGDWTGPVREIARNLTSLQASSRRA